MTGHWETLEERVSRFIKIPVKKKLEWLRQMQEFQSRHEPELRKRLRARLRDVHPDGT